MIGSVLVWGECHDREKVATEEGEYTMGANEEKLMHA